MEQVLGQVGGKKCLGFVYFILAFMFIAAPLAKR